MSILLWLITIVSEDEFLMGLYKSFERKVYYFDPFKGLFNEHRSRCKSRGMDLPVVTSKKEVTFISSNAINEFTFIGATCTDMRRNSHKNIDGSRLMSNDWINPGECYCGVSIKKNTSMFHASSCNLQTGAVCISKPKSVDDKLVIDLKTSLEVQIEKKSQEIRQKIQSLESRILKNMKNQTRIMTTGSDQMKNLITTELQILNESLNLLKHTLETKSRNDDHPPLPPFDNDDDGTRGRSSVSASESEKNSQMILRSLNDVIQRIGQTESLLEEFILTQEEFSSSLNNKTDHLIRSLDDNSLLTNHLINRISASVDILVNHTINSRKPDAHEDDDQNGMQSKFMKGRKSENSERILQDEHHNDDERITVIYKTINESLSHLSTNLKSLTLMLKVIKDDIRHQKIETNKMMDNFLNFIQATNDLERLKLKKFLMMEADDINFKVEKSSQEIKDMIIRIRETHQINFSDFERRMDQRLVSLTQAVHLLSQEVKKSDVSHDEVTYPTPPRVTSSVAASITESDIIMTPEPLIETKTENPVQLPSLDTADVFMIRQSSSGGPNGNKSQAQVVYGLIFFISILLLIVIPICLLILTKMTCKSNNDHPHHESESSIYYSEIHGATSSTSGQHKSSSDSSKHPRRERIENLYENPDESTNLEIN